jgi:hypothetical protein
MDVVIPLITTVAGILGGYLVGNRRLKYEKLYERRAEVLAKVCELLAAVERAFLDWKNPMTKINPYHPEEEAEANRQAEREEEFRATKRAVHDLVYYYHSIEVWLTPDTCEKIESFITNSYTIVDKDFPAEDSPADLTLDEDSEVAVFDAFITFMDDIQRLRRELIDEFRAILYPPPLSPLRLPAWLSSRERKGDSQ